MKVNKKFIITLITVLISTVSFAQKISFFQINGELIEIPGKWVYKTQLKESGQFHLINKNEKLSLLISVRNPEIFEFYQDNLTEEELLHKYYKWEYDYWNSPKGIKTEVSEIKQNKNYIIWKLIIKNTPHNNNKDQTSYLLYTVKNNKIIAINLSSLTDRKIPLTESESIELIEKIYLK